MKPIIPLKIINGLLAGLIIISCAISENVYAQRKGGGPPHAKKVHKKKPGHRQVAHHHYRHLQKRGAVITNLDGSAIIVTHKGNKFRFHHGVFYKPKGAASFVVVRAPFGLRVKTLPPGHRRIKLATGMYFYYFGTFYKKTSDSDAYEVVEAPVGAEVDAIPEGYETKTINGKEYIELDDVYYKPKETEDGNIIYEVVEIKE